VKNNVTLPIATYQITFHLILLLHCYYTLLN